MRLALVEGSRRTAEPDLAGVCPSCGSAMTPKCGRQRIWHWAHRGVRHCDHWWEPETEWHIAWKNRFPTEWQEIIRWADNGEKHIADVTAPGGRVVEFQHSPLSVDERGARETFYKSMVWVVDGLARKRDRKSFEKTRQMICQTPLVYSGHAVESALLRDWAGRPVDVFFDFGTNAEDIATFGTPILWHLHPNPEGRLLLTPVPTAYFVAALHKSVPLKRIHVVRTPAPVPQLPLYRPMRRSFGFQKYTGRRRRRF